MLHLFLDPSEVQWVPANHGVVRVKEMIDWPHAMHDSLSVLLFLSHLDFGGKNASKTE